MELIRFISPYYYTFKYNRKGFEGIAYFLEYTILPFITFYLFSPEINIIEILLIITIITITYEQGYIYNNIISIRKENNPTLRHTALESDFGYKHKNSIFCIRYVTISLLLFILSFNNYSYFKITFIGVVIISIIFYLYNIIREGWFNRFLFFLLRFSRYYFVLFFIGFPGFIISFLISLVSLINHLSWYSTRTKFNLPRLFGTKLFDGLIFFCFMFICFIYEEKQMAYVFLYLVLMKFILFGYKFFQIHYGVLDSNDKK